MKRAGTIMMVAIVLAACATSARANLFEDEFDTFSLGTTWQATAWDGGITGEDATGAPDGALTGGVIHNSAVTLQMASGATGGEWKGIETIAAIPTPGGNSALTVEVRTTAANTHQPIEAAIWGESGEWAKMYYTYNAWKTNYADSAGNTDAWGSWTTGTTPGAFRRWVMTIDPNGVAAEAYNADDELLHTWAFPDLTLADLGPTFDVVLRQRSGGLDPGPGAPTVWVDFARVSSVPEPATLALLGFGAAGLIARRRRR